VYLAACLASVGWCQGAAPDGPTGEDLLRLGRQQMAESRHAEAARLIERAIGLLERNSVEHPSDLRSAWEVLGSACYYQQLYRKSEQAYKRALALAVADADASTITVARILSSLGSVYQAEDRYADAEAALLRARQTLGQATAADAAVRVNVLVNLGALYRARGRNADAEPLYREALELLNAAGNRHGTLTVKVLNNLAILCMEEKRYNDAADAFAETLSLIDASMLPRSDAKALFENYDHCLRMAGRGSEARRLHARAQSILNKKPAEQTAGMVVDVAQLGVRK
jgi:tetratricopeptide (TPR) repeat protein